jgi:hypothetical protein
VWQDSRERSAEQFNVGAHFGLSRRCVLSFVLLLIAASVIETLQRLEVADPGFAVRGRLYAYIYFPTVPTSEGRRALYAQALDRLRALPGVLSASQTARYR